MRLVSSSLLEKRRPGEADECCVRQREAHVACEPSRLGAMSFVGNHDNVVAPAVGLFRVDILVELVYQTENVAVIFL